MERKITRKTLRKAIKDCEAIYTTLGGYLQVHPTTVKRFIMQPKNNDLFLLFKNKQIDLQFAAKTVLQDSIYNGDIASAKWYLDFMEKQRLHELGLNIYHSGEIGLKLTIIDGE